MAASVAYQYYSSTESLEAFENLSTSGSDTLNIVIVGKVGKGKSALVNGLVGRQVAKEEASARAITQKIERFAEDYEIKDDSGTMKVITAGIWDTPGLSDPNMDDEELEKYQTELAGYINKADLFLYCVDMSGRLERSDMTELKKLTKKTGPLIWKNAMIVLTFANNVVPEDPRVDPKRHFQNVLETWKKEVQIQLRSWLDLSEEIIHDIAIVPTGYRNKPPPDRVNWFSPFWREAFRKVKEGARFNLFAINIHRLTEEDTGTADVPPYQMDISVKDILFNTTLLDKFIACIAILEDIRKIQLRAAMPVSSSGTIYFTVPAHPLKRARNS